MLQQSKSADAGASFGTGVSNSFFGSCGSGNFITRITAIMAMLFFFISLILCNLSSKDSIKDNKSKNLATSAELEKTTLPSK